MAATKIMIIRHAEKPFGAERIGHEERFDMIWVFERAAGSSQRGFTQVPQLLLSGDRAEPIAIESSESSRVGEQSMDR